MINSAAHNVEGYPGRLKNVKLDKDVSEDLNEDNLVCRLVKSVDVETATWIFVKHVIVILKEEGPTIHELAHDDLLHNDASQDSVNAANFINSMSPVPDSRTTQSPIDLATAVQYHVTMEDGEESIGKSFSYLEILLY